MKSLCVPFIYCQLHGCFNYDWFEPFRYWQPILNAPSFSNYPPKTKLLSRLHQWGSEFEIHWFYVWASFWSGVMLRSGLTPTHKPWLPLAMENPRAVLSSKSDHAQSSSISTSDERSGLEALLPYPLASSEWCVSEVWTCLASLEINSIHSLVQDKEQTSMSTCHVRGDKPCPHDSGF